MTDDTELCSLLTLLNKPCDFKPEIGSSLIIEIRPDSNGENFVQVFFVKVTKEGSVAASPVRIDGCEEPCKVINFVIITNKSNVYDPEFEYMIVKKPTSNNLKFFPFLNIEIIFIFRCGSLFFSCSKNVWTFVFVGNDCANNISIMETLFFYFIFLK